MKRRCHCLAAFTVAASIICLNGSDAFTAPSSNIILPRPHHIGLHSHKNIDDENIINQQKHTFNLPIIDTDQFTRPLITAATSAFLATSLLFSNPLLPPPDAQALTSQASTQSQTATQIEIDLASVPALTRKAFVNRDKLTNYLIESFKSFKPILDLLSESDTVIVTPPKDIKGAVNQVLTKGDAQFVVNGESVDVRVESVPGVIIVRVINPNIPRLPFLRDGSASLKFVDDIVDVAPQELEKAAEEVQAVEKFLMWGAPEKAPITYKGSSFDYWLSSKFTYNGGNTVSLGSTLGDLTNSQVVLLVVGTGVFTAYAASYSYYISVQEEQERKEAEKKEAKKKMAAKKKKKAEKKKEKTTPPVKTESKVEKPVEVKEEKDVEETKEEEQPVVATKSAPEKQKDDTAKKEEDTMKKKGRKRDVIKNIFRGGGKKQ